MTFPTYTQTGTYAGSASSHSVDLGSFSAGDLIIVCFAAESNPTQTWTHDGATDHFTALFGVASGFGLSNQYAKYRVMQAGDSATLSVGLSASKKAGWLVIKVAAGGFDSASPCTGGGAGGGNNSSPDPPNLAPGWGALDILWLATSAHYSASGINSAPANYSGLAGYGSGTYVHISSAYRNLNASSENPGAFTLSSNNFWTAGVIAVKPSSAKPRSQGYVIT